MATYKITYFFGSSKYNIGWTENWWTSATDAASALATTSSYYTPRKNVLGDDFAIDAHRASNVDSPRDSLYVTATSFPILGTVALATYPLAGVWDCLLVRRDIGTNNLIGHMFMHGVPAGIFVGRTLANPPTPSGWTGLFNAFGTEVTGGNYLLRKKTAPTTYTYSQCTTLLQVRRTERRLGRPFDPLHGRRSVA